MHRIQVHVPAQLQKVLVTLHQFGGIPPLKQVAVRFMLQIEVDRVSRFEALHESLKIGGRRFQYQVKVVLHQAEEVQSDSVRACAFRKTSQESLAIRIVAKDGLPAISSCSDVCDCPGKLDSYMSRHDQ
jgi:hypothetical protein